MKQKLIWVANSMFDDLNKISQKEEISLMELIRRIFREFIEQNKKSE